MVEIIVDRVDFDTKSTPWPDLDPWGRVYHVEHLERKQRLEVRCKGSDGILYTKDDVVAVRNLVNNPFTVRFLHGIAGKD